VVACNALSRGSGKTRRLEFSAAAKVNLALEVLTRRPDGYHEVATVMQTVDLSDRLVLEECDALEVRTTAPGVPTDERNLVYRAAAALQKAAGIPRGARMTLDKHIPVAAGLGGGSTDAAATLIGLNRLWRLRWPLAELERLAVGLGMDVPFFLRGGAALATGRGEQLTPLGGVALGVVLVNPRFAVSTADMYGRVTPAMYSDGERARTAAAALQTRQAGRVAATLYNGLEVAAGAAYPQIGQMQAALLAAGALGATMSGSGPTVLGVARSWEQARQIRARVARGAWECWAVRTLRGPAVRLRGNGAR
jgi:4-diphosphocytidyl-2-C-methyl-D-erythritol kinase